MALEFVKGAPFKGASRHKSSRAISIFRTYQRMHHLEAGRPGEWNEVCQTLFAPPAGRVKQLRNSPRRIVVARAATATSMAVIAPPITCSGDIGNFAC